MKEDNSDIGKNIQYESSQRISFYHKLEDKMNDILSKRPQINPKIEEIYQHDDKNIKGFFYNYRWLSNFHLVKIEFMGLNFPATENAYMAAKSLDRKDQEILAYLLPSEAKKFGRLVALRDDWEIVKYKVMYEVNKIKYQHPVLRKLLLDTGDKYLEETNWWGDKIWGVCNGEGHNQLGKILMKIREEIKNEQI